MTNSEALLCEILDCVDSDLEVLERVGYEWKDVLIRIEHDDESIEDIGIEGLLDKVFEMAKSDFADAVFGRKDWLFTKEDRVGLTDAENKELNKLRHMNPWYDIQMGYSLRNARAKFTHNENAYREMFPEAIRQFYESSGIKL